MKETDPIAHSSAFDEIDLPEGHRDRFLKKLDSSFHYNRKLLAFQNYAIAASVMAILALSIFLFLKIAQFRQQSNLLAGISPELEEAELFYQKRIQEKMEVLTVSERLDQKVIQDLNAIDESFKHVEKDLRKNPDDERIIHAVMQIYQLKLETINDLLLQLK